MLSKSQRDELWKFVRGEADQQAFEHLIYFDPAYEAGLAPDLYLDLIWCNFDDWQQVETLQWALRAVLEPFEPCRCALIPRFGSPNDWNIFDANGWLATHVFVGNVGLPRCRISLTKCLCCDANWIISSNIEAEFVCVQYLSDADADLALIGGDAADHIFAPYIAMTGVDDEQTYFFDDLKGFLPETSLRKRMSKTPQITVDELAKEYPLYNVDRVRLEMLRDHIVANPIAKDTFPVASNPSVKDTAPAATNPSRSVLARVCHAVKSMFVIGR